MTTSPLAELPYESVRKQITDKSRSSLARYQRIIIGAPGLGRLLAYELIHGYLGRLPGGLGIWLRKHLYPWLLAESGRGVLFADGITLRHPGKIHLGSDVVVADGAVLDARGDTNQGIRVGDQAIIGQRAMVVCKNGDITLGRRVGVGANAMLIATGGNHLRIEDDVLIGPYTCLEGTCYHTSRLDVPIADQGCDFRGGVRVGRGAWLGAHVTVLDGVAIGQGAIIGANSVVTHDVPDFAVAAGTPARIIRYRGSEEPA